jgi:hypothetical protein
MVCREYAKKIDYVETFLITQSEIKAMSLDDKQISMNTWRMRDITVATGQGIVEPGERYAYRDAFDIGE